MNKQSIPKSEKKFHLTVFIILLLLGGTGTFYVTHSSESTKSDTKHNEKPKNDDNKPIVVSVETTQQADFSVFVNGLGTVTPLKMVIVHPRVDGQIMKITFTEGQTVKEGDLLAEIDSRPFEIALQQAEGQLLRDEALLSNAEIDYARYQTLLAQDSIAAQQTATQDAQVKQYRGIVEMDKAQVNNAKLQLSYAHLTAPISGRVGLRQVDQGNVVRANDSNGLVVITQQQPINVVFTLPEDNIQKLIQHKRRSDSISVIAYDREGKNKLAQGKLLAIDNQIDSTTGTLKLKAQFDNADNTLFPNQFVNIKMQLDTLKNATQVSSAAIQHDIQGSFVYVITTENKATIRRVKVADVQGDKVAVMENLAPNEWVVLEGVDKLREGSQVDVAQKDGQIIATEKNDKR